MVETAGKIALADFLVFEPVGPSLLEFATRVLAGEDRFTESRLKHWFRQLLEVLSYLHQQGLSYGDVSIENVRLSPKLDRVVLLGFGRAEKTAPGKDEDCGPSADVYRAGILLFCMRTMRYPFGDGETEKWRSLFYSVWRYNYWEEVARQVTSISVDFINLINGMLEADPARRFTAERVLKHQYLVFK